MKNEIVIKQSIYIYISTIIDIFDYVTNIRMHKQSFETLERESIGWRWVQNVENSSWNKYHPPSFNKK